MYKIGDNVIYKHNGVYSIEAIETPVFAKNDGSLYYKLCHLFSNAKETVYVPIEAKDAIRSVITRDGFEKSVHDVNATEIIPFNARQPLLIAEHYKNSLAINTLESSLTVLKALYIREKECDACGKKLRQAEGHYLSLAEKAVCEELCICFELELEQAKEKLRQMLEY